MEHKRVDKPWSGRFEEGTDPVVECFSASLHFDRRLFAYDIKGSIAHAKMLAHVDLISDGELQLLLTALEEIFEEIEEGSFQFDDSLEDIHMNIEARLIEKLGPLGGKIHTARSRNDQVALDMRLFLRDEVKFTLEQLFSLQRVILDKASGHIECVMPGYTHMQRAQPVSFAHHLLAYFEMFKRDMDRFRDCLKRINVLPLGSCALSGSSLPIDREFVAAELGFDSVSVNSMDAVSDRDFVIEFLSASSILMMHLSRLAEEIILWSTSEFGFVEIPDSLCTGSSIMPQKKNPDPIELVRGKTGRVYGHLMSLFVTMKALPLTYNRDMQEDKEPLFDTLDTIKSAVFIIMMCIERMKVNADQMTQAIRTGFLEATDVAEYLVMKAIPFRDAHNIVGRLVLEGIKRGWSNLSAFSIEELREYSCAFTEDVLEYLNPEKALSRKKVFGGTSPVSIKEAIQTAREALEEDA